MKNITKETSSISTLESLLLHELSPTFRKGLGKKPFEKTGWKKSLGAWL